MADVLTELLMTIDFFSDILYCRSASIQQGLNGIDPAGILFGIIFVRTDLNFSIITRYVCHIRGYFTTSTFIFHLLFC